MDTFEIQVSTPTPRKLLPALEMEVMKVLWRLETGTVGQVQEHMRDDKPLAYTTVMTMLDRLTKKGVISRRKQGRSYRYSPVMHKDHALQLALERLVHDFFGDSSQRLLEHLVHEQRQTRPIEPAAEALDSSLL